MSHGYAGRMQNRRSFVSLAAAICLLALSACSTTSMSGNALLIREVTKAPHDLTLTITVGTTAKVSGMQVDTVGDDTVVTHIDKNRARRFILSGLTGYRGKLRIDSVDLVVGGTSIWIDDDSFKAHGPDVSLDVQLAGADGGDLVGAGDLILEGNELRAIRATR